MSGDTVIIGREYLRELVQGLISAADELDACIEGFDAYVGSEDDDD